MDYALAAHGPCWGWFEQAEYAKAKVRRDMISSVGSKDAPDGKEDSAHEVENAGRCKEHTRARSPKLMV